MSLGAGRMNLDDELDYGAGIIINKSIGDYINKGDTLMTLHTNKDINIEEISTEAFLINKDKPKKQELIYEVIR